MGVQGSSKDLREPSSETRICKLIGNTAQDFSQQLSALNVLRSTSGPKNTWSRGKPAAVVSLSQLPPVTKSDFTSYLAELEASQYKEWLNTQRAPTRDNLTPKQQQKLPELSIVPPLYLQPDFDLTLPRIFDAVTEYEATVDQDSTDQMLQEKLSLYLDVVEQHLASEIALRSASFFSALSNLQSLNAQSETALEKATCLKNELQKVDIETARKGLQIARAGMRRRRMQSVQQVIERLKEVTRAQEQAQELTSHGEWEAALAIVEELSTAYTQDTAIRLNKLHCLESLPSKLTTLRKSIGKSLQVELLSVLTHELQDFSTADFEAFQVKERCTDRTRPLIRGLVRCGAGSIEEALKEWRSAVLEAVRRAIKEKLPSHEALADDDEFENVTNKKSSVATKLRILSHSEFISLLNTIFKQVSAMLEIINLHSQSLSALIEDASRTRSSGKDELAGRVSSETELQDVVFAVAELSNARCSKLILVRTEQHTSLALPEFVLLFDTVWSFLIQSEVICQKMIVGLRGAIVGQAKSFLSNFHQKKVAESAKVVEQEQWAVVDVTSTSQRAVSLIIKGAMEDPAELVLRAQQSSKDSPKALANGSSAKQVDIEGRLFFSVAACLSFLESLTDYLKVVINISLLTTDAMSKIIEFLKQFNSRTCQVVLGAGAMRSAGLKNITAKHLALAAQCLSILINLIPYVRELLRRHLNPKQAVMLVEFDKLKRDYQEHQNEIYGKLVSIMGDRLVVHCKSLQAVDWSRPTSGSCNTYMESLTKEATTLHKVLSRYMPGEPLELVMMQVMSTITAKLAEEFGKIELEDQSAKDRLLKDAHYLRSKLDGLTGFERDAPGADLEQLVNALPTKKPQAPLKIETASRGTEVVNKSVIESPTRQSDSPLGTIDATSPSTEKLQSVPLGQSNSQIKNRLGALFSKTGMKRTVSGSELPPIPADEKVQDALSQDEPSILPVIVENTLQVNGNGAENNDENNSVEVAQADADEVQMEVSPSNGEKETKQTGDLSLDSASLVVPSIIQETGSTDDLSLITADSVPAPDDESESLAHEEQPHITLEGAEQPEPEQVAREAIAPTDVESASASEQEHAATTANVSSERIDAQEAETV